jgi:hypothetical protein
MDACALRNWSWPLQAPESLASNPWFYTACEREQELIIKFDKNQNEFGDSSQTWHRAREQNSPICPTLLPGSHIWVRSMQRFIIGRDAMALQGFPVSKMKAAGTFTEGQLSDLAGNAFSVPASLAVDLAVMFNVCYSKKQKDEIQSDNFAAAALTSLLQGTSDT